MYIKHIMSMNETYISEIRVMEDSVIAYLATSRTKVLMVSKYFWWTILTINPPGA